MGNLPGQRWSRHLSSRSWPREFPLGSLESRAATCAVQSPLDIETQRQRATLLKNLTPLDQAFLEGADDPVKPSSALHMLLDAMIQICKLFGWPLPKLEDLRRKRQTLEEIDKIEQGRAALGDTAFLNREAIREMAENRLRCKPYSRPQTG